MTQDQLKRIFEEAGPDFSAEICPGTTMADLDPAAIEWLRAGWLRKSNNDALSHLTHEQLLEDAELTVDGCVTYAALILLGTHRSLGRHLAQSEVIFEYRSSEASIPAQQRVEHRRGALLFLDEVWQTINLRNDVQQVRDGLFVWDIRTFNEDAAREAILNAVSHRDYRLGGSVFVRQFPRKLEIVSPGGFPSGITPENILWRQLPRNRRIAEVFAKCGLVERSGQGANTMFEEAIKESKPRPDFSGTDDYQVSLTLHGEIQDPRFLRFLDKVGKDRVSRFTTHDLLILDLVHRELPIVESLKPRLAVLVREGIVESVGRGRGTRYLPSAQFYGFLGEKGTYTRRRGLGREANKALLLKHIRDNRREGSQLKELTQVLPFLSRYQVQELLRDLKAEGQIYNLGHTRTSRWHPTATPSDAAQTEQG